MHFHRGCGSHCGSKGAYGWEISILKAHSPAVADRLPAADVLFLRMFLKGIQKSYRLADEDNKSGR